MGNSLLIIVVLAGATALVVMISMAGSRLHTRLERRRIESRREILMEKFDDRQVVEQILIGNVWQGQTRMQLIESIGPPDDVQWKVLKTTSKEIWKYTGAGKGRGKITLEDGIVVGWDVNV